MNIRYCSALIFATLVATGCDVTGPNSSEMAAKRAQNDALWSQRQTVTDSGKAYAFSADTTREIALIAPAAGGFSYTASDLERISTAQTGCQALFQGGFLDLLDGYTPGTNLRGTQEGMENFRRWQINLDC